MLKLKSLTEDQMFAAALAYEASGCDIPVDEFLQNVLTKYKEIDAIRKKTPSPAARVGNKADLGF